MVMQRRPRAISADRQSLPVGRQRGRKQIAERAGANRWTEHFQRFARMHIPNPNGFVETDRDQLIAVLIQQHFVHGVGVTARVQGQDRLAGRKCFPIWFDRIWYRIERISTPCRNA